ncbi:penicillin-binding protein [Subtercola sp. PAMC28395]|uniref:transglycosylase domain-containing protein n=1 Tax=Subtercola sp. PAMC28395 TaxID=2846775 RepID=UPI001C0AD656|nr:transglycosylase domain-containing protein [Subtercola sp. PAMC28395]QWT24813.1 penicillin-binding protein [Subtercola sp. PAMC28395]
MMNSHRIGAGIRAMLGIVFFSVVAGVLVTSMVAPVIAVAGQGANATISVFENLPDYIKPDVLSQTSSIYAKNSDGSDVLLASFFEQNRQVVGWNDISQNVKDAVVSTEDPRFYEHGALDLQSTTRALLGNFFRKGIASGASTISQQYVKNILSQRAEAIADPVERQKAYDEATAQTPNRKLREAKLAIGLERTYSKDDILLGYLNIALFGGRIYGIQAAARYYFGVDAGALSVAQAASLVAIVNEPEGLRLDIDAEHTENNRLRRDKDVLPSMLKAHAITQQQFDEAVATPIETHITPPSTGCQTAAEGAGFFCDYVKKIIEQDPVFGDSPEARAHKLKTGGYKIYTTLDLALQKQADSTTKYFIPYSGNSLDLGSSLVTVEPGTGRITSMAQNKNFSEVPDAGPDSTSINFATDVDFGGSTGFPVGSTYKLFTLINWLQSGHSLGDIVNGANNQNFPLSKFTNSCTGGYGGGTYKVGNDAGEAGGRASVLTQFEESVNNAFIAMAQQLDQCETRNIAKALGVHRADGNELGMNIADVLGSNEIAPLTMAAAYAGVVNKGVYCNPVAIASISDSAGAAVEVPKSTCAQVIDADVAVAATYAMKGVIDNGTATRADPGDGTPHFGKTGTATNEEHVWLVGGTSKLVTSAWTGNIDGHVSIRRSTIDGPGSGPVGSGISRLLMWRQFYGDLADGYGGDSFPAPSRSLTYGATSIVPEVSGLSPDDASRRLSDAGFEVVDGGQIDSDKPVGQVVRSDPPSGAGVTRGSNVSIFTSNGRLIVTPKPSPPPAPGSPTPASPAPTG